ncbi:hypothetical protein LTS07_010115 [Exophiala sideris]|uniref:Phytanoyl-CoA dioxygenase n=1 Tax=Exophiala sideris TaxID=1016849 RepID=A0ABR0IXS2_9EURO|nr:hypothetical protein LTS07_010115 [Exophiala sideris]KAK5051309.1 hypothetical protein LTR69_010335 [Exophiala sideris]
MAPSLVTIDASEPLDKIIDVVLRDGGVIVANMLSPELLKEVMGAIEPYFVGRKLYDSKSSAGELGADFFPAGSQRVYALLAKMPEQLTKIMRLPVWQGIMGRFLNDEFASFTGEKLLPQKSGYMLASTAALRLVPGSKPQPLHRDQIAYQTRPDPNNPFFTPMVGCLIAGSRATYKNGATAVIPGSHLWGADRAPKVEEVTYAEMEPGSALFTLGCKFVDIENPTRVTANVSSAKQPTTALARTNVIAESGSINSQRDYFRQDQDEVLSTPIEIARKLPDDILRLSGYYKAIGGVGYVEDHQSPVEFLQKDNLGTGAYGAASVKVAI